MLASASIPTPATPTTTPDAKDATAIEPTYVAREKQVRPDRNRSLYFKNKLEGSFETAWLPINIPFVFDFLLGSRYSRWPLSYTLNPNLLSLRWQLNNASGPSFLRGNWELSFSGAATIIPRGPETRYFAYDMGIRRYFVQRNWRVVPYTDGRLGVGDINAKGPRGVLYAQGQNLTFTVMLGSGLRFNVSPDCAIWGGLNYMHVSNMYLSEPKYENFGINVYGPLVGIDFTIHRKNRTVAVARDHSQG